MTLREYITESLSKDLKDRLIGIISSDNITDEVAAKMINTYDSLMLDKKAIEDHIIDVGLEKNSKAIIRLLRDHDFLVQYSDIVTTNDFISDDEILKGNNIYDILQKKYPSISYEMMNEIALLNYADSNGIARGKFEILLDLFLGDITKLNAGSGDVNTKKYAYELKASGARMGSVSYSPVNIDNYINSVLMTKSGKVHKLKNTMSIEDATTNTYEALSGVGLTDKECCDTMIRALFAQFGLDVIGTNGKHFTNIKGKKIDVDFDYIYDNVFKGGKFNVKSMKRFHGCINIAVYHNLEKWDYMMIFKGTNSTNVANRGDYIFIDSEEADSLISLYEDRRFDLSRGGKDDNYDKYCILTSK